VITAALLLIAAGPTFADVEGVPLHCSENIRGKVGNAKVEVVFAVGALAEAEDRQGEAHVLEHVALRPLGFDHSNGETSWDFTSYFTAVRAEKLPEAARTLLQALRETPRDRRALDLEREIVLREIDDRGAERAHPLVSQLFGGSKVDRPLAGTKDTLANITVESLAAFHRQHYTRANMAVVLPGATNCASITASIAPEIAAFESGIVDDTEAIGAPKIGRRDLRDAGGTFIGGFYWYETTPQGEALARVVGKLLQQRALGELRKDRGLAYSPSGRLVRLGPAGMVYLIVETKDQSRAVATWFDDTVGTLRGQLDTGAMLTDAIRESVRDLELDYPRLALAAIRDEPSPIDVTIALADDAKPLLDRLLSDDHRFSTPAGSIAGIVVLLLFGAGVLGFFAFLLRSFLRGDR